MDVSLRKLVSRVLVVAVLIAVLDQVSKNYIESSIRVGQIVPVIDDFFNLTLLYNRGAAFGLFSSLPDPIRGIVLSVTSTIALIFVAVLLIKDFRHNQFAHSALGLIVGGGLGNGFDRVRYGGVVDFLDFYLGTYHWPAFNVADSAIFLGVVMLLLLGSKPKSSEAPRS